MEQLLANIKACTLCEADLPLGARPLLQISSNARILIAGQAPGRKAHQSGIPFDDASGDRLRQWLGVSREVFYDPNKIALLPMGFCYPGTGKNGDLPPRSECEPAWRQQLLAKLPKLSMTLVLGQYAQRYHFDNHRLSLTERVASWRETWPTKMALPHPSPRNNRWLSKNPWFETELLPALKARVATIINQ
ncbi:MAG: uracil-DNA glycosylase family protein [Immundisolibacteraceae bacterium]|nr:uracil-DNA glycosylase family protein [Immundisolibacteraceae bacterium]